MWNLFYALWKDFLLLKGMKIKNRGLTKKPRLKTLEI